MLANRSFDTDTRTGRPPRGAQVIVHIAVAYRRVPVNFDVRPHDRA